MIREVVKKIVDETLATVMMDWSKAEFPESLPNMWALDTETTGLSQDDKAVSCSVAFPDRPSLWFAWGHASGNNCGIEEFIEWGNYQLNAPDTKRIFHNAQFDIRMLHAAGFNLRLDGLEDTGIIAPLIDERLESFGLDFLSKTYLGKGKHDDRPLNEWCSQRFKGRPETKNQVRNYHKAPGRMVAPYGVKDAELTLELYQKMRPLLSEKDELGYDLERVYEVESGLIAMLVMMNRVGFRVDVPAAERLSDDIEEMIEERLIGWNAMTGGINQNSSKQMAAYFEAEGVDIPRTDRGNPSVTSLFLKTLSHPAAIMAVEIKRLEKFKGTFVRNYILKNVNERGLIHGQFHQLKKDDQRGGATGTVSGRFSSSGGLNLQNLPSPDPDNAHTIKHQLSERVRGAFTRYYDGGRILSVDYSQIEFRLIAHYAGGKLLKEYLDDPEVDFHTMVANITGISRKPAKNINFGLAYGMGVKLMAERLGVTFLEAQRMLETYHARLPEVKMIYNMAMRRATKRGYIRTLLDRKRRFIEDPERRYGPYKATHKALNALAQGGGADVMKLAMVRCADYIDWKEIVLHATVHDELVFTVPEGPRGDEIILEIKRRMEAVGPELGVEIPILAEAKTGMNWGQVTKWTGRKTVTQPERPSETEATLDDLRI